MFYTLHTSYLILHLNALKISCGSYFFRVIPRHLRRDDLSKGPAKVPPEDINDNRQRQRQCSARRRPFSGPCV